MCDPTAGSLDHPREAEQQQQQPLGSSPHPAVRAAQQSQVSPPVNQGPMDLLCWEPGQREFPEVGEGLEYLHTFLIKTPKQTGGSAPSVEGFGLTVPSTPQVTDVAFSYVKEMGCLTKGKQSDYTCYWSALRCHTVSPGFLCWMLVYLHPSRAFLVPTASSCNRAVPNPLLAA